MKRDPGTYEKIREQYDDWTELMARKPVQPHAYPPRSHSEPEPESDMSKWVFTAIGVGIGVMLLALAAFSFWTASQWAGYARNGAFTGYTLVGIFLTIAGVGGILATWNHNFRVLEGKGGAAAH
jgi:hypothetical protein